MLRERDTSFTNRKSTGIPRNQPFQFSKLFSVLYYFLFFYDLFPRQSPQCITSSTSGFSEKATQWKKQYIINKQEVDWNQLFQFSKIKDFGTLSLNVVLMASLSSVVFLPEFDIL